MEPNLNDIDDYNKPTPNKKVRNILIFFGVLIAIYAVYALFMESL